MDQSTQLMMFFAIVLGVVLLPGMDMAFVLGSALTGGRRNGLAAVAGIVAGAAVHVIIGVAGFAIVLTVFPVAFNLLLLAGAAYIAWIGIALLRSDAAFAMGPGAPVRTATATFGQAALTNLLNPKAYVFMLAIFPQFLVPERGSLAVQALVLGIIIAATQAAVYGAIALLAARARGWFTTKPSANRALARVVGTMLVLAAAFTGIQGWQRM